MDGKIKAEKWPRARHSVGCLLLMQLVCVTVEMAIISGLLAGHSTLKKGSHFWPLIPMLCFHDNHWSKEHLYLADGAGSINLY